MRQRKKYWCWFWWFGPPDMRRTGTFDTKQKCEESMSGYGGEAVRVKKCHCRGLCKCYFWVREEKLLKKKGAVK